MKIKKMFAAAWLFCMFTTALYGTPGNPWNEVGLTPKVVGPGTHYGIVGVVYTYPDQNGIYVGAEAGAHARDGYIITEAYANYGDLANFVCAPTITIENDSKFVLFCAYFILPFGSTPIPPLTRSMNGPRQMDASSSEVKHYILHYSGKVEPEKKSKSKGKFDPNWSFKAGTGGYMLQVITTDEDNGDVELKRLPENERYAWINENAEFPKLYAVIAGVGIPKQVTYTVELEYTSRSSYLPVGKDDGKKINRVIKTKVPITYTSNDPGLPWDFSKILKSLNNENYFSGGRVKVKTNFGDECVFHIRGKNPTKTIADDYIKNEVGNPVIEWMPIGIARHETGTCEYAHFNKRGVFNAGDSDIKFTPNEAGDGGLGLFQLTNSPTPENRHFWNWKINSDAGIQKLKECYKYATAWMKEQRIQAKGDLPPVYSSSGMTFGDGQSKPMEHAVALKKYNGLGNESFNKETGRNVNGYNFCYWNSKIRKWQLQPLVILRYKDKKNGKYVYQDNCYVAKVVADYLAGEK